MAKPKAFIVDDDPVFVKLLENQLRQFDFTPFETYMSGEECLANIKHKPRVVLLDFSLGGLNGLDVLRKIKEISPGTAVVMLTAIDDELVKQKCLEAGAFNYIIKDPDGLERLKAEVLPRFKSGFLSFLRR